MRSGAAPNGASRANRGAIAAPEMGGREAMAGATSAPLVEAHTRSSACGAVLWRACRHARASASSALLNDTNPHLINFYRWFQRGLACRLMENMNIVLPSSYPVNQPVADGRQDTAEGAATVLLPQPHRIQRPVSVQQQGRIQRPFRKIRADWLHARLHAVQGCLLGWTFTYADFEMIRLGRHDSVYADPPYDVDFTTYAQGGILLGGSSQNGGVARCAHKGPVILVNQATPRIRGSLCSYWHHAALPLDAPRRISCDGDRTPAKEVIAVRNISNPYWEPTNVSTRRADRQGGPEHV